MAYIFQEITPGYASHHNSQLSQSKTFGHKLVGARQCSLGDRKGIWPVQKNLCITLTVKYTFRTSCVRGDTICPSPSPPPLRRNVAVLSHAEYIPTLTAAAALRVKAALSKAACCP